ncbi:MAG: hypothetical protein SGI73_04285 [Chloroflexota bacterium]|nr:hypothetical protein [Chloroflexota bacterium]
MRRWTWIALVVLLASFGATTERVRACSGPGVGLVYIERLMQTSFVVVGEFTQGDSLSNTGFFRVEEYILGHGGEYLLVSLNDTASVLTYRFNRYLGGGCQFPNSAFRVGARYLIFMNRNLDGHYTAINEGVFAIDDPTTNFRLSFDLERHRVFTFLELRAYVLAQNDAIPQLPDMDRPMPLAAPLLLTSYENRSYLIPVDGSALVDLTLDQVEVYRRLPHCEYIGCTAFSPNGLDQISLAAASHSYFPSPFYGQALHISTNSQLIAVRRDDEVGIYTLWYPRVGQGMEIAEINRFALTSTSLIEATNLRMVWSSDSRWLAFSDARGLWIWDVLAVGQPARLLMSSTGGIFPTFPRLFSGGGRYLAVEQGNERYHIDVYTLERLPDGLIAPHDRAMLVFDTRHNQWQSQDIKALWLPSRQANPLFTGDANEAIYDLRWYSEYQYQFGVCRWQAVYIDEVTVDKEYFSCFTWVQEFGMASTVYTNGYNVIRHPQLEIDASLLSDTTLATPNFVRDYASVIDSPIMHIEWLPSLFYYDD